MRQLRRLASRAGATRVSWPSATSPIYVHENHALEPVAPTADGADGDLTGLRVWEAAPFLIEFLDQHRSSLLHGRRVLELGAGTGACGIAAAKLGARHTVLSDADVSASLATEGGWQTRSTLAQLAENVALNGLRANVDVAVAELRWGSSRQAAAVGRRWGPFDTLIASDVLYYPPATYERLATTIRALTVPGAHVVLSFKVRHGDEASFARLLLAEEGGCCGCDGGGARFQVADSSERGATGGAVVQLVALRRL
mmetsp:Transcript_1135/g.2976  ORF Transcript_1135/g.2976 Transcript_1135/m.2976 type:complete len:255 (-) Transcript_1135:109-873(-)|eukprot:6987700-Prymnesium_polylepis.1